MLDLIKPKLVFLDLPLFMALLSDLFPGVELPPALDNVLVNAVETELREQNLQVRGEYVYEPLAYLKQIVFMSDFCFCCCCRCAVIVCMSPWF